MTQIVTHIGMAKCLSTALQSAWDRAENYQILKPTSLIEQIDLIVSDNNGDWQALGEIASNQQLKRDRFEQLAGDVVVLSSENMTTSFTTEARANSTWIHSKHRAMASLFGACSDSILLLVRDPLSWTTSMYYQYIRQGGSLAFRQYVDLYAQNILSNLDIKGILEAFNAVCKNVVILPLELARHDEPAFWEEYRDRLGVPLPNPSELPKHPVDSNVTRTSSIATHRKLNSLMQAVETTLNRQNFDDKSAVLDGLYMTKNWGMRRAMSLGSDQELEDVAELIGLRESSAKTEDISDLSAPLVECFLEPLRTSTQFPYPEWLQQYEDNLRSGTVLVY